MIPVSVIVTTRNEAANIARCLEALHDFSEVLVVDSSSEDGTQKIAEATGARVINYQWNGRYPKKRQWCLDNLELKNNFVFFVDADEVLTCALIGEIRKCSFDCAGYFVKGCYVLGRRALRFGLKNNKLCLIDKNKIAFPVIDDLDIEGMGEIEGHYQPILKHGCGHEKTGSFKAPLLHYAYDQGWDARHQRYATWERLMNEKRAWPQDPVRGREALKRIFRALPCRGVIAFLHCYIWKMGVLDGRSGLWFAASRYRYYKMIGS